MFMALHLDTGGMLFACVLITLYRVQLIQKSAKLLAGLKAAENSNAFNAPEASELLA